MDPLKKRVEDFMKLSDEELLSHTNTIGTPSSNLAQSVLQHRLSKNIEKLDKSTGLYSKAIGALTTILRLADHSGRTGGKSSLKCPPRRTPVGNGKIENLAAHQEQEDSICFRKDDPRARTGFGIINRYYHRFEIEEFFRDAKRLLGLEQVSWQTETSLAVTLWFVILGIWCLKHMADGMDEIAKRSREKMQLSETRYLFEALRTEIFCTAEAKYLHSYDV